MYKTSDTPNLSAFPDTCYIEVENAAGNQEHVLGAVINAIATDAAATAEDKTRFTVLSKSSNFAIAKSDGNKAYYRMTGAIDVDIVTAAAGGYEIGDEVTLVNRDGSAKTITPTGCTVNTAASWSLGFNEVGSAITLICVGATEWDAHGDMEVA